jgi:dTDP-4-dehydrorhamnose reductase
MRAQMVIGASGMIGEHLLNELNLLGRHTIPTFKATPIPSGHQLTITDENEVNILLKRTRPQIIYLAAALTNVEYCETHARESYMVNVTGTQNVVKAANQIKAKLVYFSTDYIFNGEEGPYVEEAAADPINIYGQHKLDAEHYISLFANDYLIIRTTVVYGWERQEKNFIYRLIKSLSHGQPLRVAVDQVGSPTYAQNLSQVAITLSEASINGVINIAGSQLANRYEFAKKAAAVFGMDENLIIPVQTDQLKQQARRPLKAGLLTTKLTEISKIPAVTYEDGLRLMAKSIQQSPKAAL